MSGSGHPTDSPLKVEKVRIWRLGGRHWENPSTINIFFLKELNFKNSQFLMYTVWSANHFIGTINKFYEIRKITLQYTKNLQK